MRCNFVDSAWIKLFKGSYLTFSTRRGTSSPDSNYTRDKGCWVDLQCFRWSHPTYRNWFPVVYYPNNVKPKSLRNRSLPSSKNLLFQNEAKCTTFLVKISFICMRMKNHFHIQGSALNLVLIQRPAGTRKWLTWKVGMVLVIPWKPRFSFMQNPHLLLCRPKLGPIPEIQITLSQKRKHRMARRQGILWEKWL